MDWNACSRASLSRRRKAKMHANIHANIQRRLLNILQRRKQPTLRRLWCQLEKKTQTAVLISPKRGTAPKRAKIWAVLTQIGNWSQKVPTFILNVDPLPTLAKNEPDILVSKNSLNQNADCQIAERLRLANDFIPLTSGGVLGGEQANMGSTTTDLELISKGTQSYLIRRLHG